MRYVGLLADLATKAPTVSVMEIDGEDTQHARVSCCCLCRHAQACVYHLSLAVSLHDLTLAGHPSVHSLADSIAAKWVQEANAESLTPQQVGGE